MLDLDRLRLEYDEWRRRERLRDSDARWQAFIAGAKSAPMPPELTELAALPERQREWVLNVLRQAIEAAKDMNPPKP